jgi:flavin reductase (DIM6/NTAB) family NADH-FMN oxidoreductase RutF
MMATSDQRRFRDALGTFATGVTIVTTQSADVVHGMTANGFMSVSLEPALVVVSIASRARMHDLLAETGRYGVSVLACEQEHVSRHFAGRPANRAIELDEVEGVPLVGGALTHVVARVVDAHRAGDHTLYVGEVLHFEHRPGEPLIFHSGAYRSLMDGGADEWAGELHTWGLRL